MQHEINQGLDPSTKSQLKENLPPVSSSHSCSISMSTKDMLAKMK